MQNYLYLSLIPEALILSQLPPEQFGRYLATGSKRQIEGPAIFFTVDQTADLSGFRLAEAQARCVAHPDGQPRHSVYVAIHDVLQRVPLVALQVVHLTTPAGHTLTLNPQPWSGQSNGEAYYMYQELGPVYPRVAAQADPGAFCALVTDPAELISLPRLAFIDLKLGGLAYEPERTDVAPVPYQHLDHLRECLRDLAGKPDRKTKIVNRGLRPDILFYLIRSGVYVGGGGEMRYYPIPSEDELEEKHYLWWHSAQSVRGY
jgi:hypothetical protein